MKSLKCAFNFSVNYHLCKGIFFIDFFFFPIFYPKNLMIIMWQEGSLPKPVINCNFV